MKSYKLTAFAANGEKLIEESFEAENDDRAKIYGQQLINKKDLSEKTHRCTSSSGKLILFHA